MLYQMNPREIKYGLIQNAQLFGSYGKNHKFDAVVFIHVAGPSFTITGHNKGPFKMSATGAPRVDGFTFLTKAGITTFDIWVGNDNKIYIQV